MIGGLISAGAGMILAMLVIGGVIKFIAGLAECFGIIKECKEIEKKYGVTRKDVDRVMGCKESSG